MLVVVLISVEIACTRSPARHHDVEPTPMVRVTVSHAAEDRHLVDDGGTPWQHVGDLNAGNIGADILKVASDFRRGILCAWLQAKARRSG